MVPVLNTANIRDGELRRLSTWETHRDALALVDNVYHRIAGISKDDGLITLEDAEGNTRLISPREAVAEGVTLYTPDTIRVGTGDRMRFTKSDRERGYVANSIWTVTVSRCRTASRPGGFAPVRSRQSNILTWPMPSPPTVHRGRVKPLPSRLKARKVTGN